MKAVYLPIQLKLPEVLSGWRAPSLKHVTQPRHKIYLELQLSVMNNDLIRNMQPMARKTTMVFFENKRVPF